MIGNTHQRNVTHAEISSRTVSHVTTFRKVLVVSVQTASIHNHDDAGSPGGDLSDVWNMAPGSIETTCRDFPDCTRGEKCPFTHAGREREQNEEAIKIEKNNDFVQPQGLSGLKKK